MPLITGRRAALAGAAALAISARPSRAQSQPASAAALSNPGFHRIRVGSYVATFLFDGIARFPLEGMVANQPIEAVRALLAESFMPTEHFLSSYTAVVVDTGRRKLHLRCGHGRAACSDGGRHGWAHARGWDRAA